jgi:hypothetical protein
MTVTVALLSQGQKTYLWIGSTAHHPAFRNRFSASIQLLTPSLAYTCSRCLETVRGLIPRRWPMMSPVSPFSKGFWICCSLAVSE